jgi:phosphoenolpyruvate-protein kinase (PTS system EI component)
MESQPTQTIRLQGIGVSSGIILGKAFLVEQGKVEIPTYSLQEKDEIEKEIKIFLKAIDTTQSQFLENCGLAEQTRLRKELSRC